MSSAVTISSFEPRIVRTLRLVSDRSADEYEPSRISPSNSDEWFLRYAVPAVPPRE